MAKVFNEIKNIFRFEDQLKLVFSSDYKKVTTVKEVLNDPTMRNWEICCFEGETIELEELKLIMDMATPDIIFYCYANECPIDFTHENAFKFANCYYKDARWVKVEDLFKMNKCYTAILGRNSLTQTDFKKFFEYWVNSEIDMFFRLEIETEEVLDPTEMLDGLTLLYIEQRDTCFTKVKSSGSRDNTVLFFSYTPNYLHLEAWPPGEFFSLVGKELDEAINKKHWVIDSLIEKKRLEEQWESTDSEKKKQKYSKRLRQLDDEIKDYGVFFVDGKATMRDPYSEHLVHIL
ncbi:hypothetical protein CAEBREN_17643 [Caenorhabditis brenneri]|uniref:Sdz-33 F-box domain-containing protein n=1 Tax=Caenorhabditis brenneri TaxID=135651 RepID=G0NHD0_CAEBE|nr:hypothetical protein CAEBREN_17643 [Caenorhabditis brenneri]